MRGKMIERVSMTDIKKLIETTEALLDAGTQEKWDVSTSYCGDGSILVTDDCDEATEADIELMNHAPTALRELIAECKRLQGLYNLACMAIDESTVCPECKSKESVSECTKCEHQWGD